MNFQKTTKDTLSALGLACLLCLATAVPAFAQDATDTEEVDVETSGRAVGETTARDNIMSGYEESEEKATERACEKICEARKPNPKCTFKSVESASSDPDPDPTSWRRKSPQGRYCARREGSWSCTCRFDCPKTGSGTGNAAIYSVFGEDLDGALQEDEELELLLYELLAE